MSSSKKNNKPENSEEIVDTSTENSVQSAEESTALEAADTAENAASETVDETAIAATPEVTDNAVSTAPENTAATTSGNAAPKKAKKKIANPFTSKRFKYGGLSIALTVLFVAAVIVINVIANLVINRFNVNIDLTDEGLYSVTPSTETYVEGLSDDIMITLLNDETTYENNGTSYKQVNEIMKKFANLNDNIKLRYVNIDQNPDIAAGYKETLAANNILVESADTERVRMISPYDYFEFNQEYLQQGYYMISGSNIEQELTSALMYVTDRSPVRVAFTEGYNEADSTAFQSLLTKNGYTVEAINITNVDAIDSGIDYIVMFAPALDYENDQLVKLDAFLDNGNKFGKNLIYVASVQQPSTPNLNNFLADWGLSVGEESVAQSDPNYVFRISQTSNPYAHYQQLADTDYASTMANPSLYIYNIYTRPVYTLFEVKGNITTSALVTSYDGCYAIPFSADENWDINNAATGMFNDMVLAEKVRYEGTEPFMSRVVVCGSEYLFDQTFLDYSNSNNAEFIVGVFNKISGKDVGVSITPKSFGYTSFEMTEATINTLTIVLSVVVPLAVIIFGIVIWIRRRHR